MFWILLLLLAVFSILAVATIMIVNVVFFIELFCKAGKHIAEKCKK